MASVLQNIKERLRKWLFKGSGLEPILQSPDDTSLRYIQDLDEIIQREAQECEIWFSGNSNDILNFYTQFAIADKWKEPIYNANRFNFFWAVSSREKDIKRVHSGIPKAIIKSVVNAIGTPEIKSSDLELDKKLQTILKESDFYNILKDEIIPKALALGDVAVQVNINSELSPYPTLSVFGFREIEPLNIANKNIGVVFRDFFKHDEKIFVRYQQRFSAKGNSFITSEMFEYNGGNLKAPNIKKTPQLLDYIDDKIEFVNVDMPFCEYLRFNVNPKNKDRGVSVLIDKLDLFDSIDQALSQQSRTIQKSGPVEYVPNSLAMRDDRGNELKNNDYDRTYRVYDSVITGEGDQAHFIKTTQPNLNAEQYQVIIKFLIEMATLGIVSPNTIGFSDSSNTEGLQYYNNSGASIIQKERISVNTREDIITRLVPFIKSLLVKQILLYDINKGQHTDIDFVRENINVAFTEYYKEGFADKVHLYSKVFSENLITPELFVEYTWGDKLTPEQQFDLVSYIKHQQSIDNLDFNDLISKVPSKTTKINDDDDDDLTKD
jgi:hypothetical protein